MYMTDGDHPIADEMFLNFWWTEDKLAGDDLLAASATKAKELGIDPYSLYAGIDVQADGYDTPVKWKPVRRQGWQDAYLSRPVLPELGILVRRQSDHIPQKRESSMG